MAIAGGPCISAKRDFILGVHGPNDQYKIALYTPRANIAPWTQVYSPDGEVPDGNGYQRGGRILAGFQCGIDGTVGFDNPSEREFMVLALDLSRKRRQARRERILKALDVYA